MKSRQLLEFLENGIDAIQTPEQLGTFLYTFAQENKLAMIHNGLKDQYGYCGNAILVLSNELFIVDFPVGNTKPRLMKLNISEKPVSQFHVGKWNFYSNIKTRNASANSWLTLDKHLQALIFNNLSIMDLENWLCATIKAADQLIKILKRLRSPDVVSLQKDIEQIGYKRFFGYGSEPCYYDLSSLKTLVHRSLIKYILTGAPLPLDQIQLLAKNTLRTFSDALPVCNPSMWFYNTAIYGNIDSDWFDHLLQNYQIDINIQVEDGRGDGGYGINKISALHKIAGKKDVDSLKLLIKQGADINLLSTVTKESPLTIAIAAGNIPAVHALLDAGADVTVNANTDKPQPLFEAIQKGDITIVKLIVDKNKDFDVFGGFYGSVLTTAVHYDRCEILKLLLQYNVDTERRWKLKFPGGRALSLAVRKGNIEMIDALLSKGANVYFDETWEPNVLLVAWEKDRKDIIDRIMLHHKKDIRQLYPFIQHKAELRQYIENLLQSNNVALPRDYPPELVYDWGTRCYRIRDKSSFRSFHW